MNLKFKRNNNIKLKKFLSANQRMGIMIRVIIIILAVIFLIWSQNNLVLTRKYVFTSKNLPKTFVGYTIVNISDIHNTNNGIINKVKKANPDLILVNGDMIGDNGKYNRTIDILSEISNIADTYFVLSHNDAQNSTLIYDIGNGPVYLDNNYITINSPVIDTDVFIDKYIGNKIVNKAIEGDELSQNYIEYTKLKLEQDKDRVLRVSGLNYDNDFSLDSIYSIIGTDKSEFQISFTHLSDRFDNISNTDIDVLFSGGTHGFDTDGIKYNKGVYSKAGTTMFVSGGVGNSSDYPNRTFNFPEITMVVLSDGTIKQENFLEKILGYFISDVDTKFDNDGGFKEYTYMYKNTYTNDYE